MDSAGLFVRRLLLRTERRPCVWLYGNSFRDPGGRRGKTPADAAYPNWTRLAVAPRPGDVLLFNTVLSALAFVANRC